MKTIGWIKLLSITALMTASAVTASAAHLSVSDVDIYQGETYVAPVNLVDASDIKAFRGFQFDIMLTDGVTLDTELSSPIDGFNIDTEELSDGSIRIISFTQGQQPAKGYQYIMYLALSIADDAPLGIHRMGIANVVLTTPDALDVRLDNFDFAVNILPKEEPWTPDTPYIPDTYVPDGMYGNANGTWISALKIREGNALQMGVNDPVGGWPEGWNYLWYAPDNALIGEAQTITTSAELYGEAAKSGDRQSISNNVYDVTVTNYNPSDEVFWTKDLATAQVAVYKRPQAPTQLLRKGQHPTGGQTPETGTSCTFVIMMTPLDNNEILELGYRYVYGYTDPQGNMHELETTERRYTHTTYEIYNDASLTFWAYSLWTYPDGSVVSSGLRYLDGTEDYDFDVSDFSGMSRSGEADVLQGIYTLDGRHVGFDIDALAPGIYIIRNTNSSYKIIK